VSDAEIIIGNYKLLNCLATGSQSQVWEAMEVASTERYAMKLLLPEAHKNLEQKTALKHEANVAKSLDHPNIIKFHSIVINKEYAYYMMELFRAPNLKIQIQTELPSLQMRLKRMVELMGAALGHMHEKGWLHKDVKPENILFSKSSELRLIDFSLAGKIVSGFGKFFSGSRNAVQGTRTYMAPEQIRGRSAVPQTDI
jgi:serine/threonine-protein kinase